jgi:hypothetical protein
LGCDFGSDLSLDDRAGFSRTTSSKRRVSKHGVDMATMPIASQ